MSAYLYRQFDAAGSLLYVGISGAVMKRTIQHEEKNWFKDVRTITVEYFESRDQATRAEREAIKSEAPAYNSQMVIKRRPVPVFSPMRPIQNLSTQEKKKLRTMEDDDLEKIKRSHGNSSSVGYKFGISSAIVRHIRGEEVELKIHQQEFDEILSDYFASQERTARKEMEIVMDYLRQRSSQ